MANTANERDDIQEVFDCMKRWRSQLLENGVRIDRHETIAAAEKDEFFRFLGDYLLWTDSFMADLSHLASRGPELNAVLRGTNRPSARTAQGSLPGTDRSSVRTAQGSHDASSHAVLRSTKRGLPNEAQESQDTLAPKRRCSDQVSRSPRGERCESIPPRTRRPRDSRPLHPPLTRGSARTVNQEEIRREDRQRDSR